MTEPDFRRGGRLTGGDGGAIQDDTARLGNDAVPQREPVNPAGDAAVMTRMGRRPSPAHETPWIAPTYRQPARRLKPGGPSPGSRRIAARAAAERIRRAAEHARRIGRAVGVFAYLRREHAGVPHGMRGSAAEDFTAGSGGGAAQRERPPRSCPRVGNRRPGHRPRTAGHRGHLGVWSAACNPCSVRRR